VFILADNKPVHIHIVQPQVSNKYSENILFFFFCTNDISFTHSNPISDWRLQARFREN